MNQLQGPGHDKGVRQLVAPLDASPKRSLTLTADGPDTPLAKTQSGLKSIDDGDLKSDTPDIQMAIPPISFKSFDGGWGLPAYNFFQELFKNPI